MMEEFYKFPHITVLILRFTESEPDYDILPHGPFMHLLCVALQGRVVRFKREYSDDPAVDFQSDELLQCTIQGIFYSFKVRSKINFSSLGNVSATEEIRAAITIRTQIVLEDRWRLPTALSEGYDIKWQSPALVAQLRGMFVSCIAQDQPTSALLVG
jgi:hypothetical protein